MKSLSILFAFAFCIACTACSNDSGEAVRPSASVSPERTTFQDVKEQTVRNPKDAEAWYHLASLYEDARMYPEEIETLTKVIALAPDKGYAYVKLGTAYNRIGRYADAVRAFSHAKKFYPKNPLIYNNQAVSYGMIGKHSEEIQELEKAIALRPHYATARYNLGMVLLKQGKRDAAMRQYRALLEFDITTAASLKKELDTERK